jgi:hypothetical protein
MIVTEELETFSGLSVASAESMHGNPAQIQVTLTLTPRTKLPRPLQATMSSPILEMTYWTDNTIVLVAVTAASSDPVAVTVTL